MTDTRCSLSRASVRRRRCSCTRSRASCSAYSQRSRAATQRSEREPGYYRAPVALSVGFALGMTWPAYSLDRAFAETGMRGSVLRRPLRSLRLRRPWSGARSSDRPVRRVLFTGLLERLSTSSAAFRLAVAGAVGTAIVVVWELALVHSPPEESARLAIYWVDDRWRWPLLLVAGTVGLSGLGMARSARVTSSRLLVGGLPWARADGSRRPPDSRLVPVPPAVPDPARHRRRGRARPCREHADAGDRARDVRCSPSASRWRRSSRLRRA